MLSRAIQPKRRGRRPLAALAIVTVVAGLLITSGTALAVHDDGRSSSTATCTASAPPTNVGGNAPRPSTGTACSTRPVPTKIRCRPASRRRLRSSDFIGRTRQRVVQHVATRRRSPPAARTRCRSRGWQCNLDNNVNSKIDVMNAYAAAYMAPNGDEIMYFALERNTNTGDAQRRLLVPPGRDVGCESRRRHRRLQRRHTDGDLLVVSEFTNGGGVSHDRGLPLGRRRQRLR